MLESVDVAGLVLACRSEVFRRGRNEETVTETVWIAADKLQETNPAPAETLKHPKPTV